MSEFTPQAGRDYEISDRAKIDQRIYELDTLTGTQNNKVKAKIGKEVSYKRCP